MAIQTRQITGPIETPEHQVVLTGFLRVQLLYPIADDETLIAPFKLEYSITDGDLPASCQIATPGSYQFQILDIEEERVWTFQVDVFPNSGTPISIAELWQISRLTEVVGGGQDPENFDASLLGSDGAEDGQVLTADGTGGAEWEFPSGDGLGDMLKAVYDTNDDARVNAADHATNADAATNADQLDGLEATAFQLALQDAINEGTLLSWDDPQQKYLPNENVRISDDGTIYINELRLTGATFTNPFVMTQVYYLIDDETHVLVTTENNVELALPNPTTNVGRVIEVKKASTDGKIVTISVAGGGTIEGNSNYYLSFQYEAVTLVAINNEWFIF